MMWQGSREKKKIDRQNVRRAECVLNSFASKGKYILTWGGCIVITLIPCIIPDIFQDI